MNKILSIIGGLILLTFSIITPASQMTQQTSPNLPLTYTIQDFDQSGKLVSSITRPSHSYVKAMLFALYTQMAQGSAGSSIDVGGVSRAWATPGTNIWEFGSSDTAGSTTYGIVAGTGTNAVAQTDYQIQTLIANGSGSGQLMYSDMGMTNFATTEPTSSFTWTRVLSNLSGGSITINELAFYIIGFYGTNTKGYFCIIRDVVSPGQAVASGHNVAVTYTFSFSY